MRHRSHLTAEERKIVSRVHWLLGKPGLLRANIVRMKRKCGNKNCRCTKGSPHASWYLYQSRQGKANMLYVPSEREKDVAEWVRKNKEIRELLDKLSQLYWEKIKNREE